MNRKNSASELLDAALESATSFAWEQLGESKRRRIESLLSPGAINAAKQGLSRRLKWIIDSQSSAPFDLDTVSRHSAEGEAGRLDKKGKRQPDCDFLDLYPNLRRIFLRQVNAWGRFIADFARHAEEFAEELNWDRSRPLISGLTTNLSDPHCGGRTVLRIRLKNDAIWYYKPRSGRHEEVWARIVRELNAAGFSPPLMAAPVVARRDHCWMPKVAHKSCRSWKEVGRFYFRSGALLYLAHALRAVDLHAGNWIACGEHPVLIDCETMLHPNIAVPDTAPDQPGSILRTGMLPVGPAKERGKCPSFLGGMVQGDHSITLQKRRVFANEAINDIVLGFQTMSGFLGHVWKRSAFQDAIRAMQSLPIRSIYRPTRFYVELLRDSLSSQFAGSKEARRWFLHSRLEDGLCGKAIVQREAEQLLQCDIPLFRRRAAARRSLLVPSEIRPMLQTLQKSLEI
jgi:lantibiotic modifying enzyme